MFTKFLNNKQNYTKNFAFWVRSYIYDYEHITIQNVETRILVS